MPAGEPKQALPARVRTLLLERVPGLEHLEVLLLACREGGRGWSVEEVGARLGMDPDQVAPVLEALHARELIVPTDSLRSSYVFRPATQALREACVELCEAHARDRFQIVNAMSRIAMERINRSVAVAFANAFRLRKPPSGGG